MPESSSFDTPIRDEEQSSLRTEIINRLHQRGVNYTGGDATDRLDDLLSAVQAFDAAVVQAGGDLMVDMPDTSRPDDPRFIVPQPRADEALTAYLRRIQDATRRIEQGSAGAP